MFEEYILNLLVDFHIPCRDTTFRLDDGVLDLIFKVSTGQTVSDLCGGGGHF